VQLQPNLQLLEPLSGKPCAAECGLLLLQLPAASLQFMPAWNISLSVASRILFFFTMPLILMANVSQRQIVNKLAEPNLSAILKNIQLDDWFCLAGG